MKTKKNRIIFIAVCVAVLMLVLGILSAVGVDVNWYGLLIGLAFLLGLLLVQELAVVRGLPRDTGFDLLIAIFPCAIIGARLFYVAFSPELNWTLVDVLQVWHGGLSIIGGVIGGFVGVCIYSLIKKQSPLKFTDIIVPALLLGQAIGRWGNFANQEVYGREITNKALQWFPFGVFIDSTQTWHYALFFYESLLTLACAVVILCLFKKFKQVGIITGIYLMFYGIVRAIMEGFRDGQFILSTNGGLAISRFMSYAFIVLGACVITIEILKYCKEVKKNGKERAN